jgi:hypothetical protein
MGKKHCLNCGILDDSKKCHCKNYLKFDLPFFSIASIDYRTIQIRITEHNELYLELVFDENKGELTRRYVLDNRVIYVGTDSIKGMKASEGKLV